MDNLVISLHRSEVSTSLRLSAVLRSVDALRPVCGAERREYVIASPSPHPAFALR